jgi:hypothetical protein
MRIAQVVLSLVIVSASTHCIAAESLLAVFQKPEYPIPGKPYAYPPGLLFEVCADGSAYRARQGGGESGRLDGSAMGDFRGPSDETWLGSLRAECTAHGTTPDAAYIEIIPALGDKFECSHYQEGPSLKDFEARIAALQLVDALALDTPLNRFCNP